MSWFRQLKIMYAIRVLIFTYIIWIVVINLMFRIFMGYQLFFISLGAVMLMQIMKDRKKDKADIILPSAAGGILSLLMNGTNILNTILYLIYIGSVLYLLYKMDEEIISHELYADRAKKAVFVLIAAGFITVFEKNISIKLSIGRFLIFYLVAMVITLRESRQFQYAIRSSRSIIGNAAAVLIIILLSLDKVFYLVRTVFVTLIRWAVNAIDFVLITLVKLILSVFGKQLEKLVEIIRKMLLINNSAINPMSQTQSDAQKLFDKLPEKQFHMPVIFEYAVGIMVLLIIIYFIFKLLNLETYSREVNSGNEKIQREKIERVKKKHKLKIHGMLKKILGSGDIKQEILDLYKSFEKILNNKKLFKEHMTAMQLSNIASVDVDDRKHLDIMAEVYNEAKFSEHKITDNKLHSMKDSFNNVKKQL